MDISYIREALDYDPETGLLTWRVRPKHHFKGTKGYNLWKARFAGNPPGSIDAKGYLRVTIDGKAFRAHRLAWALANGEHPSHEIDHINGNPLDNRLVNLRAAKAMDNARNRSLRVDNKHGVPGLLWWEDRQKWSASIGVGGGKAKSLGFYETKDEAIAARRGAEIVLGYHENHGRQKTS